jgi:hypothetical protein
MCFHLKYDLHSCSSYLFQIYHHPHFDNFLDSIRLHVGFLSDILTRSLFRGPKLEKSIQEISRFNLSKVFGGVLKMHSGELIMRFMPTAPIHIL